MSIVAGVPRELQVQSIKMLFNFSNFLHDTIKYIVECHHTTGYRYKQKFEIFKFLYWLLRMSTSGLIFVDPVTYPMYRYDYFNRYMWENRMILNEFYIIIILLLILANLLGVKVFLLADVSTLSVQSIYECIVVDSARLKQFMADNRGKLRFRMAKRIEFYSNRFNRNWWLSMIVPKFVRNFYIRIRVTIDSWWRMYCIDVQEAKRQLFPLQWFPYSSIESRYWAMFAVMIIDWFNLFAHFIIVITSMVGLILIWPQIFAYDLVQNSWLIKLLVIIESFSIIETVFTSLQFALLQCDVIIVATILMKRTLNELNDHFNRIVDHLSNDDRKNRSRIFIVMMLRQIYVKHIRISSNHLYASKEAWGRALYLFALVGIPINATSICKISFETLTVQTRALFIAITLTHAVTSLTPFITLAIICNHFHRLKNHIPRMQFYLKYFRIKLKYDDLYQRLMTGRKITFTLGHLGVITFPGLLKVLTSYFVAFFLIMKIYLQETARID